MLVLQAELQAVPQQISDLKALRDRTQNLSCYQVDLNINLTVTVNGASIRSGSTNIGSCVVNTSNV